MARDFPADEVRSASNEDRSGLRWQQPRLSFFVAPRSMDGDIDAVRLRFKSRTGLDATWTYSGADYIALGACPGGKVLRSARDPESFLVVHGELIKVNGGIESEFVQSFCERFAAEDTNQVALDLRGSFVLLALAKASLALILDRVGSRKLYRWNSSEGSWFDTDLRAFLDRGVDAAGVASMIINRFTYGGRTVLKDVAALPRASVIRFDGHHWNHSEYWTYDFGGARQDAFMRGLPGKRIELWDLLNQAVHRRIPHEGSILLLLSGGIDSRAILASLASRRTAWGNVRGASYGSADDDDAAVASELAARLGFQWTLLHGSTDLPDLIDLNAKYGGGQVFFYPRGLDGIAELTSSIPGPVTAFVGDECYGWSDMPLNSREDVFTQGIGIRSPAFVPPYYSYGVESHRSITEALQADVEAVDKRYSHVTSLQDLKDVLYLDQRLSHMLLTWRERHLGPFARIANPHIDEDILDFMRLVPTEFRLNKRLFRETALQHLGDMQGVRFARTGGCSNDFLDPLFVRYQADIDARIRGTPSALDRVLPAELIRIGLSNMCFEIRARSSGRLTLSTSFVRRMNSMTNRVRLSRLPAADPNRRPGGLGSMSLSPIQMGTVLQLRQFFESGSASAGPTSEAIGT